MNNLKEKITKKNKFEDDDELLEKMYKKNKDKKKTNKKHSFRTEKKEMVE
nr:MAG TPA: hypothetical protein [Caudoviricetes sp.]